MKSLSVRDFCDDLKAATAPKFRLPDFLIVKIAEIRTLREPSYQRTKELSSSIHSSSDYADNISYLLHALLIKRPEKAS